MLGLVANEIMARRGLIRAQAACGATSAVWEELSHCVCDSTLLASGSTLRTVTVVQFFLFGCVFFKQDVPSDHPDHPLPINPWILGCGMPVRNRMVYYYSEQFAKMHFHSEGRHAVRDENLGSMSDLHMITGSTGCCCETWGTFLTLHMPQMSHM